MIIIGIDPGISGGIAVIETFKTLAPLAYEVLDLPVTEKLYGKGRQVNAALLANHLRDLAGDLPDLVQIFVEQVSAMPPIKGKVRVAGTVSSFTFGEGFGIIQGVLSGLGHGYRMVRPPVWKAHFGLTGKEKDVARTMAIQRYPSVMDRLKRKKDIGRADALMIATYGYEFLKQEGLI